MVVRIGTEFLVNTLYTAGTQGFADVAGTADGSFVVTWKSEVRSDLDPGEWDFNIHARKIGIGQPIADEFRVNTITADAQFSPTIAVRPDGGYAIAYSSGEENHLDGTSVNTQLLTPDGIPTGPEQLTRYDYYHRSPAIGAFSDNRTVAIWNGEYMGEGEIRAADGSLISNFTFGWDGGGGGPKALATFADDRFVVLWHGYQNEEDAQSGASDAFYGQIHYGDGGAGRIFEIGPAPGRIPEPSVTELSNGTFVVIWQDDRVGVDPAIDPDGADIKGRIFTSEGEPISDVFTINENVNADQFNADVAALSDGRFVVTWQDGNGEPGIPNPGSAIRAGIFDHRGTRIGDEFQVNTSSFIDQGDPAVAAIGGDRFVIVWTDGSGEGGDITDGGIKAQYFSVDTAPVAQTIRGTGANDRLTGGFADDVISGGKGADTLFGGVGEDQLLGGKGEDSLYGGLDDDALIGGWQSDRLYGELGDDTLHGDLAAIAAGSRGGNDRLFGGEGDDILFGDAETIAAGGHGGDDVLTGGIGNDFIYGDGRAGAGVAAGGGDDTIDGGEGYDQFWGGGGNDRYVFKGLTWSDVIHDFGQEAGNRDILDLRQTEAAFQGNLQITYVNGNAVVDFGSGRVTLIGVTELDPSLILI